ncbi:Glycosyltransferase involved in cell wall bisynthesis [Granulicella rosea]|uniref:Glycosyltransferase involved in cell wall bisynthesis n=1 Tax=Granulicella rosea TaxID=474952 RepID=A0A239KU30_9BACT|nr:glycosyltransferase family 4 protein [Granulicella rosea]SNT21009.1 Glycosyltransferase involved in cell wall bisynthesis [Granulicella rosea]
MKIVQATFGVFHHFELARELLRRGHLERIYSTFPWRRLRREGIPRELVETFPWVHATQFVLGRVPGLPPAVDVYLDRLLGTSFDSWTARRMPACDALIALSGTGLENGRVARSRGGRFICDRGSTHRVHQAEIVEQEHRIWKQPFRPDAQRTVSRELAIYDLADAIVVPSLAARRSFLERGHAPEKVHAIPYGVRLESFSPRGAPPVDRFEVLYVGGVALRKGIPYLLQAFAALRHPNKRLRIVGWIAQEVKALLATLPQDGVEWLGALPQSELPAMMSASHALVLPSIEDGFGLVVPQSMACGCVPICSANAGAADAIADGVDGFIVEARRADLIAGRLQQLADDPALRERISAAALASVRRLGGWTQYGDQWESLLLQLTTPQLTTPVVAAPSP